jgi:hypothetical protein
MRTNLGQMITDIQQAAAGISTADLRWEIETGLDELDNAVDELQSLHTGSDVMDRINATSTFMETVIQTALFVRELATRPVDDDRTVVITPN